MNKQRAIAGGDIIGDGRNGFSKEFEFDFRPLGNAIKNARNTKGLTREKFSEIIDYAPRHIQAIENDGQIPSLNLLVRLVTMFDISVDQYIFSDSNSEKSTVRRQLDSIPSRNTD